MKIVHVIQGLPRTAGTTVFVVELARQQILAGCDVKIIYYNTCDDEMSDKCVEFGKSLDSLRYMPDVVHIHAIWSMCQLKAMQWCIKNSVRFIVSPHGSLMPRVFNKGWIKKHLVYWLLVKNKLQKASVIHCTGQGEVDAIQHLNLHPKIVQIPIGCNVCLDFKKIRTKNILFLGRLGEEKGLVTLFDAWKLLNTDWTLLIAGPSWKGYGEILEEKVRSEDIKNVKFLGSADEEMKDLLYRNADVFVLPSPVENFSIVVLDALAYGVPVICTRGTPWSEIERKKCGWWIEPNSAVAIADALRRAISMTPEELSAMGERGRVLAKEKYSWKHISCEMLKLYK